MRNQVFVIVCVNECLSFRYWVWGHFVQSSLFCLELGLIQTKSGNAANKQVSILLICVVWLGCVVQTAGSAKKINCAPAAESRRRVNFWKEATQCHTVVGYELISQSERGWSTQLGGFKDVDLLLWMGWRSHITNLIGSATAVIVVYCSVWPLFFH